MDPFETQMETEDTIWMATVSEMNKVTCAVVSDRIVKPFEDGWWELRRLMSDSAYSNCFMNELDMNRYIENEQNRP